MADDDSEKQLSAAEGYAEWSKIYDSSYNPLINLETAYLDQFLPEVKGKSIVEAGCGTGRKLQILRERGATKLVGLDFSPEMLKLAIQKFGSEIQFHQHDIKKLWPIDNDSADMVVFSLVLEHIRDLQFPFAEANRVLKNKGVILISEIHPSYREQGFQASFKFEADVKKRLVESYHHSIGDFQKAAELTGFIITSQNDWGKPSLLTIQMEKTKLHP